MSTNKELLVTLNALRKANGKPELASWKSSREKLEAAIQAEQPASQDGPSAEADQTDPSMPMGENGNQLVETTDDFQMSQEELDAQSGRKTEDQEPAASDLSDVEGRTEQPTEAPAIPRGAIGAMSIDLLSTTDLPYEEIVARIKEKYPTAKTTARSLASVAMDLRRDGVDVPSRRKPAKAKEAKVEAPQAAEA